MTWKRRASLSRNVSRTAIERYGPGQATCGSQEVYFPRIRYTGTTIITPSPQIPGGVTGIRIRQKVIYWHPRQDCLCRATLPFFLDTNGPDGTSEGWSSRSMQLLNLTSFKVLPSPSWMARSLLSWNCDRGSVLGVSCSHQLIRWQSFSTW